jgi:hypothetical protein
LALVEAEAVRHRELSHPLARRRPTSLTGAFR